jgi:hydroxymethylglutaryl-CoA reductase (NADPH)
MPVYSDISKEIIEKILKEGNVSDIESRLKKKSIKDKPLPHQLSRQTSCTKDDQKRRVALIKQTGADIKYINDDKNIDDPEIYKNNIENFIGTAKVPIGIIGPLRINGVYANGDFYVPLATTEGALIASYNRGAMVISYSGGASVICLTERVSRAPGFLFENLSEAGKFIIWASDQTENFKELAKTTTNHGELMNIKYTLEGNHVFIIFEYTTGDASGQNMVTIATQKILEYIVKVSPIKIKKYFLESNISGDKKASSISYLYVRGKKVTAEVIVPKELVSRLLHTTVSNVMDYAKISIFGAFHAGIFGIQGHYANALAGIFIACGQDAACVSESHVGITRLDETDSGDLYASVTLPNLIVGTIGGGTNLPTQKESLDMIGCYGNGNSRKFAEICAVTVLAGELSIIAALATNTFAEAHLKYGRNK